MVCYVFQVIADQDLAGPLVFCLLFGGALLLHGKVWLLISKNYFLFGKFSWASLSFGFSFGNVNLASEIKLR